MTEMETVTEDARHQVSLTKELITCPNYRRTRLCCMGRVHMENRKCESSSRNTETQSQKEGLFLVSQSVLHPYTKERKKVKLN